MHKPGPLASHWCGSLVAPTLLTATFVGLAWVLLAPSWLSILVLLGLFVVPLAWIATSLLWPARAERTCPACRGQGVRRLDAATTYGLRCDLCGWQSEEESGWLLAEEEDSALEPIVLRQRGRSLFGVGAGVGSESAAGAPASARGPAPSASDQRMDSPSRVD
jgi:hypothetical protein